MKVSTLGLGRTNPYVTFSALMGKMPINGLYRCNQYFDLKKIGDSKKLKLASYYLDGIALYCHQNFEEFGRPRSNIGRLCRGQKDPVNAPNPLLLLSF